MADLARAARIARQRAAQERQAELTRSFGAYAREAWKQVEPSSPVVWGWHLDCIIAHCEAVQRGEIRTLLVNIPPRHAKSTLISVILPGWLWVNEPGLKMMTGSYVMDLATRDAVATRELITSPWHRQTWPDILIDPGRGEKTRYGLKKIERDGVLTGGGQRFCFTTTGRTTGEGGQIAIYDDPHNAQDIFSPTAMETAKRFYQTTLPSRMNDPLRSTQIVIMQRLATNDLSSHMLAEAMEDHDPDLVHVCLPAHFDPPRRCVTRWFTDPRQKAGDLLWPERMNTRALRQVTKKMTPQAISAQMEQQPISAATAIFLRSRWRVWTEWRLPVCSVVAISFDPALKDREINDRWALQVWGVFEDPEDGKPAFMLLAAWADHMTYPEAKRRLLQTVSDWTIEGEPPDYVIIEDKAAGPPLLHELGLAQVANLVAYNPGRRSKMERFHLQSDLHYSGRIWVPGKKLGDKTRSAMVLPSWAEDVVAEMEAIGTAGVPDDHGDAAAQAWHLLRDLRLVRIPDTDAPEDEDDVHDVYAAERREPAYS